MSELRDFRGPYKTLARLKDLVRQERCPLCEIKLTSKFHTDCPYAQDIHSSAQPIDKPSENTHTDSNG